MDRKANRAIIRKVLLTEWDPIGVSDIPEAQDEYDAYADTVCGMLVNQTASVDAIAQYLFKIATGIWGFRTKDLLSVATRLQELSRHSSQTSEPTHNQGQMRYSPDAYAAHHHPRDLQEWKCRIFRAQKKVAATIPNAPVTTRHKFSPMATLRGFSSAHLLRVMIAARA